MICRTYVISWCNGHTTRLYKLICVAQQLSAWFVIILMENWNSNRYEELRKFVKPYWDTYYTTVLRVNVISKALRLHDTLQNYCKLCHRLCKIRNMPLRWARFVSNQCILVQIKSKRILASSVQSMRKLRELIIFWNTDQTGYD